MMQRIRKTVDAVIGAVIAGLMGLLVINVAWQVVSRYVLGSPSSYSEELARYGLIWAGLLGAAYASGRGLHLSIDLLPRAAGDRGRAILKMLIDACMLAFALAVMVWGGGRLVWMTIVLGQKSAAMRVPLGVVYLAIPLSGMVMAFYAVCGLLAGSREQDARTAAPGADVSNPAAPRP